MCEKTTKSIDIEPDNIETELPRAISSSCLRIQKKFFASEPEVSSFLCTLLTCGGAYMMNSIDKDGPEDVLHHLYKAQQAVDAMNALYERKAKDDQTKPE